MTLEDKVYQMNQFVGLDHMKQGNPNDDKENNDAQGFYKTLSVNDVSKMCEEGKIGSFLHVLTAKEANYLQELALKSPLKIPVLIGIDAIHGNALVSGTTVYPSPIGLASTWDDDFLIFHRKTNCQRDESYRKSLDLYTKHRYIKRPALGYVLEKH